MFGNDSRWERFGSFQEKGRKKVRGWSPESSDVERNEAAFAGFANPFYLPKLRAWDLYTQSNGKPLKRLLMITFEVEKLSLAAVWRMDCRALLLVSGLAWQHQILLSVRGA